MNIHVHWYLPTNGDSRDIVGSGDGSQHTLGAVADGFRAPTIDYLGQVARAAEHLGFEAAADADRHLVRGRLAHHGRAAQRDAERLKFLVAFRPGLISPTLAAQMAAHLPAHVRAAGCCSTSSPAASAHEQRTFGDCLDNDERYARTDEFLTVVRGAVARRAVRLRGQAPTGRAAPGSGQSPTRCPRSTSAAPSPAAETVAAQHADVYLTWGEPPEAVAAEGRPWIRRPRRGAGPRAAVRHPAATYHPRHLRGGLGRGRPAARPARRRRDRARCRPAAPPASRWASAGCSTCTAAAAAGLEIHPNVWAGVGLVRGGAGTALVGSHEEVADRIEEYHALGIDEFILSGHPHLEEAYWFGEGVLPILRTARPASGDDRGPARTQTPPPLDGANHQSGDAAEGVRG